MLILYRIKENVPFQMEFFLFSWQKGVEGGEKKRVSNVKIIKKMAGVFSPRIKAV